MNTIDTHTKEKFWIRVFFNPEKEHFQKDKIIISAIRRAYRDLNRTLRLENNKNSGEIREREMLKKNAVQYLEGALPKLYQPEYSDQIFFDIKHHETCLGLTDLFPMNYGQAQKWVNMSLKYLVLLGEDWVTGIDGNIHLYHPPFDNIVLNEMKKKTDTHLKRPWSQWSKEDYEEILILFRKLYKVHPPLISEFVLFNEEGKV